MVNAFRITGSASDVREEINYILKIWKCNTTAEFVCHDDSADGISIGTNPNDGIQISNQFASKDFFAPQLNNEGFVVDKSTGNIDYIFTAFYCINSLQEYKDKDKDELGRFKFRNSYQCRLKNEQSNVVQICLDEISRKAGVKPPAIKSRFFLTHDIDVVYGAIMEDGFNVLRKGRIDIFFRLLFHVAINKPDWLNIDKILSIESEYDCRSVFYWIVNKGRINQREVNADYDFHAKEVRRQFSMVEKAGAENGLHKSISQESFSQEIKKFGTMPLGNRYHYLKYSLPQAYHDIEQSGLRLDASLGFAEEMGFRNNYGLPFTPFDLVNRKSYSFVEAPLHIMDRTFFQYQKASPSSVARRIIDFFERNNRNCILSVLWHNNFFSNYKFKGYLDAYKKILLYIKENEYKTISQREIIEQFLIK